MRLASLFVLVMPLLIGACAVKGQAFVGTWVDEGEAVAVVQMVGRKATVVSVVDSDNEVFVITGSTLKGDTLTWSYLVPSTEFNVTIVGQSPVSGTMQSAWSNDSGDSGTEVLTKRE